MIAAKSNGHRYGEAEKTRANNQHADAAINTLTRRVPYSDTKENGV
jgi:hypothetical protein